MRSITERKTAILAKIVERRTERIASAALAERLQARLSDVEQHVEALRAELSIPVWAELDSGAAIAVGDRVRYLMKTYVCMAAHSKALTRRPTNADHWQAVG